MRKPTRNIKTTRNLARTAGFGEVSPRPEVTHDTNSPYLTSILKPFTGPAAIPDDNMTTSHPKAVELNMNIVIPNTVNSGSCAFVYLPHSRFQPIKFFIKRVGTQVYMYGGEIGYDQQLSANYDLGRFVSGALRIQSATISGGIFNVAGTINAAAFQQLQDVSTITYNTVTSIKRNDLDVVASVPVEEGIIALAFPDGNNDFALFNTPQSYSIDGVLDNTTTFIFGGTTPGWNNTLVTPFDSNLAPGFIAPNLGWGEVYLTALIDLILGPGSSVVVSFTVTYQSISTVDWTTVITTNQNDSTTVSNAGVANATIRVPLAVNYDAGAPISRITVTVTGAYPAISNSQLTYSAVQYYQQGMNSSGTFIACEQLNPLQVITLSGVGNFEVVPNASLQKDITTSYFGPFNPLELDFVTHYLANAVANHVRFVWRSREYENWVMLGVDKHLPMQHLAEASGFSDFLSDMLSYLKPIARTGLPLLGGAVLGPEGAVLGNALSAFIPESASFSYGASNRNMYR